MTDDLENLHPEVREAVKHCDRNFALAPYNGHRANWPLLRAELLRLQSTESRANEWQLRAEKAEAELDALRNIQSTLADEVTQKERAEAELAALKARIAGSPACNVFTDAKVYCGVPRDWAGKRVRLVVEE